MTDNEALLLSIAVLEQANARLRDHVARGVGPASPTERASYVTAWFFGIAAIVIAALVGYSLPA